MIVPFVVTMLVGVALFFPMIIFVFGISTPFCCINKFLFLMKNYSHFHLLI
ncbi:hypothetical protein Lalb_Chr14g0374411 [Lupinus albus]|uniref:Uncharacterized protein n=1 Tax=Lupinus albus TaxID=3870 RepID=A0A6A4PGH3_LUPAL|nr:hypothetical protein Lalb_Chr14g0374411 [Lupinus albus]